MGGAITLMDPMVEPATIPIIKDVVHLDDSVTWDGINRARASGAAGGLSKSDELPPGSRLNSARPTPVLSRRRRLHALSEGSPGFGPGHDQIDLSERIAEKTRCVRRDGSLAQVRD